MVARRNDVNANLLFHLVGKVQQSELSGPGDGGLVPVVVEPAGPRAAPTGSAMGLGPSPEPPSWLEGLRAKLCRSS